MQDRPDAKELGAALARFLLEQVRPAVPRELRFQLLVAANAAAILAREAAVGDAPAAERARLARLMPDLPNEARVARRELARAIRSGSLDDRWEEVVGVLRESVRAKLAVAHPGYDGLADDGRD
jgi:Domain of unknown function (DUF6285)